MSSVRVASSLLLMLVALVVCAGPAAASAGHDQPVATSTDCPYQPLTTLHTGDSGQMPRREDDVPPLPAVAGQAPVAVLSAGHTDTAPAPPPERTLLAPSPVEQLCVDRN